jgi:hypothetical protein
MSNSSTIGIDVNAHRLKAYSVDDTNYAITTKGSLVPRMNAKIPVERSNRQFVLSSLWLLNDAQM